MISRRSLSLPFALLSALFFSLVPSAMGVAWLWYGMSLGDDMPRAPGEAIGHYSFHIMGAIFIAAGLGTFGFNFMKFRARAKI